MQRIRLVISLTALVATITLGLSWNSGIVQAEDAGECNCIDGFTKRDGIYQYDPDQQRYRCIPGCYIITAVDSTL